MQIVFVALLGIGQQPAFSARFGRRGRGSHHQTDLMQLQQVAGVVAPHIHKPKLLHRVSRGSAEVDGIAIDLTHLHPAIEMQTAPPAHPLALKLGNRGLNAGAHHKTHVVEFHLAALDAAAQHNEKQLGLLRRAHAGMQPLKPTPPRTRRSRLRWW